jgi:serine/threonine-protein kinase
VAQVASALDAAHEAGLVHRDVKPANVLLGDGHVYLTDFGLTRLAAADTSVTESGQWMGTVDYASPEQLQGERCDARSDVYALGCVLFAALTGGPPYPRGTVPATMVAHLRGHIPRVSGVAGVPAAMDRVIARALAKSPEDRYLSTGDLARAAEAALHGEHVTEEERSVARGRAAPPASSTAATVIEEAAGALSRPEDPRYGAVPAGAGDAVSGRSGVSDGPRREDPTRRLGDPPAPARGLPIDDAAAPPPVNGAGAPAPDRDAPTRRIAPASPAGGAPVRRRRRRGARRLALALLLAGAVAAAGGAVATLGQGDPPLVGPVDEDEVQDVLDRFAGAMAAEDPRALQRTLTTGASRVTPADRQDGRAAVVAEYRRQFAGNALNGYELLDADVDGGEIGRAVARYSAPREGSAPITGKIVFDVVRERGRVRIALIAATPD